MSPESATGETARLTVEEFERLPEEDAWRTELVRGRVVREPPAGFGHSRLGVRLASLLHAFAREHDLGVAVGADAGFVLSTDPPIVRAPDVAFVSSDRLPAEIPSGFARFVPDLAVEVVSPSDASSKLREKVLEYLDAGVRLVWVVNPETRTVAVYRPCREIRLLREGDELDGGEVLTGFRVAVSDIFGR